uniref:Uncharacterized protein n=1 Tax=Tetranychus urticae TaxID=32264 RepID=T1KYP0_TETUR
MLSVNRFLLSPNLYPNLNPTPPAYKKRYYMLREKCFAQKGLLCAHTHTQSHLTLTSYINYTNTCFHVKLLFINCCLISLFLHHYSTVTVSFPNYQVSMFKIIQNQTNMDCDHS